MIQYIKDNTAKTPKQLFLNKKIFDFVIATCFKSERSQSGDKI